MMYTCVLCGAGGGSGQQGPYPATYQCHACPGRSTEIPIEVQRMVREQVAQELEKQNAWITNTAAANIARNMVERY